MYLRKRHPRAWAAIPAFAFILASSVMVGPTANAESTAPTITTAFTLDAGNVPNAVFILAAQIPVAVVTIPRLPSTSTIDEYEQLTLLNFGLGIVVGFVLVLIGGLLTLGRGSPQDR